MADSLSQVCGIADSLTALQLNLLTRINKKFAALQSLARLLEQLSDLQSWLPDLTGLIPVIQIDLGMYNTLMANCPSLNLPPATGSLNQLQAAVAQAYNQLLSQVMQSPLFRLGQVQGQFDSFMSGMNSGGFGQAAQFMACLQFMCGGASAGLSATASAQLNTFAKNYAANNGSVLSPSGQAKYQQATAAVTALTNLGATAHPTYAAAKAALAKK